jgi:hypothetical protein
VQYGRSYEGREIGKKWRKGGREGLEEGREWRKDVREEGRKGIRKQ